MILGSGKKPAPHLGECRTPEDVRLLFERYRIEARSHAGLPLPMTAVERAREARRAARPLGAAR